MDKIRLRKSKKPSIDRISNKLGYKKDNIYNPKEKTIKVYFSNPDDIRLLDEFVVGRIYYNSEGQGHSYAELDKIRRIEAIEK